MAFLSRHDSTRSTPEHWLVAEGTEAPDPTLDTLNCATPWLCNTISVNQYIYRNRCMSVCLEIYIYIHTHIQRKMPMKALKPGTGIPPTARRRSRKQSHFLLLSRHQIPSRPTPPCVSGFWLLRGWRFRGPVCKVQDGSEFHLSSKL